MASKKVAEYAQRMREKKQAEVSHVSSPIIISRGVERAGVPPISLLQITSLRRYSTAFCCVLGV